jgi:predicted DNA-binding transcriptional regulator AlpA
MSTRRTRSCSGVVAAQAHQLSLALDTAPAPNARPLPPIRQRRVSERNLPMDPIVYMRDVVHLVGRHRSTILRWIDRKRFPAKSVPHDHPTGWLRSDIERWQHGDRTVTETPSSGGFVHEPARHDRPGH